VVVMMMVMVVMMPLAKRGRRGKHGEKKYNSEKLLHRLHPSMALISGWRPIPPARIQKQTT
jgi:hypothetical protein